MPVIVARGIGTDVGANVDTVPGSVGTYGAGAKGAIAPGTIERKSVRARASYATLAPSARASDASGILATLGGTHVAMEHAGSSPGDAQLWGPRRTMSSRAPREMRMLAPSPRQSMRSARSRTNGSSGAIVTPCTIVAGTDASIRRPLMMTVTIASATASAITNGPRA